MRVRYQRTGAAGVLTLDRAARRNAIDRETAEAIVEAIRAFERDDGARVLVVTGSDEVFCCGADLKALDSLAPRVGSPGGVFGARRFLSKPGIAAISGWCLGGGVSLATCRPRDGAAPGTALAARGPCRRHQSNGTPRAAAVVLSSSHAAPSTSIPWALRRALSANSGSPATSTARDGSAGGEALT